MVKFVFERASNALVSDYLRHWQANSNRNSVIGLGTQIEESVVVENSVIWSNSKISSRTEIIESGIGHRCNIGRNVGLNMESSANGRISPISRNYMLWYEQKHTNVV